MISLAGMQGEAPKARRELRREEMARFGADIPWLADPTLIPEATVAYHPDVVSPFTNIGLWMIDQLAAWSERAHLGLSFGPTFDKYDLTGEQRVAVRESFQKSTRTAFGPGIGAMSEIYSTIPFVAMREGKNASEWSEIAAKSKAFGAQIARDGTNAQVLMRLYLKGHNYHSLDSEPFDPSRLRLDETTGITTVSPIKELVSAARKAAEDHFFVEDHSGVCIGLQVPLEEFDGASMFDVVWDAYNVAVGSYIYPLLQFDPTRVPAQAAPEGGAFDLTFDALARQQIENFRNAGIHLAPPNSAGDR